MKDKRVVIIGAGVSGLTAAIYLARYGFDTKVITGYSFGSLSETPLVENYPGFPEGISGYDLLENFNQQAIKSGAEIIDAMAENIDFDKSTVTSDLSDTYNYDALVVATGLNHRQISFNGQENIKSHIHYCATCDGALYKGKTVGVVGGGDTALTEALYLSNIANEVYIFIRRDEFRGTKCLVDKILSKKNITVFRSSQIESYDGLFHINSKEKSHSVQMDGLFVSIGFDENTKLIIDKIGNTYEKHFNNVWLAGDCWKNQYRQAVIAAGDGAKTAIDIFNWFQSK